jgi:hypothetical protein
LPDWKISTVIRNDPAVSRVEPALLDDYGAYRAFVGGLLRCVLEFRRNIVNDNFSHFVAHLEDFRAGIDAQATGGTGVFDSHLHI